MSGKFGANWTPSVILRTLCTTYTMGWGETVA